MEREEFAEVARRLQPRLLRYARMYLDSAAAEDVVQETLLGLWLKSLAPRDPRSGPRNPNALAHLILVGRIRNEYRARARLKAAMPSLAGDQAARSASLAGVDQVDEWEAVRYFLDQLSPEDREVVLLYSNGLTIDETAAVLGCSSAAAAGRRTRARNRLRAIRDRELVASHDRQAP